MSGPKCANFGCWSYTTHKSGLCAQCRKASTYPDWICGPCGDAIGRRIPNIATWHEGDACGWCGRKTITTEPRDYGYPPPPPAAKALGAGR
jgi:hypothetical protein